MNDISRFLLVAVLVSSLDCTIQDENVDPIGTLARRTAVAVQQLNMDQPEMTHWGLMHLALIFPLDQKFLFQNNEVSLEGLLSNPIGNCDRPLFEQSEENASGRRGSFYYEYMDHPLQLAGYRAMGLTHTYEERSLEWKSVASEVESLRGVAALHEDPVWALMAASLAANAVRDIRLRAFCADYSRRAVMRVLDIVKTHPCGGCHAVVSLLLASYFVDLPVEVEGEIWSLAENLRDQIRVLRQTDGYIPLWGLHNPTFPVSLQDRIYVLGHIVEFLGIAGPPYNDIEQMIMQDFAVEASESLLRPQVTGRLLGSICHGLSGLSWAAQDPRRDSH